MKQVAKKILGLRTYSRIRKFILETISFVRGGYYILPKRKITYSHDLLYTYHNADFMKDPLFMESYRLGKSTDRDFLLKDYDIEWRVHVLFWAASQAMHLEGDFVECGVHTGIYARAIINFVNFSKSNKSYYLLDTFTGLDARYSSKEEMERNVKMGYQKRGDIYEDVKQTFSQFGNVKIIRGAVPETLVQVNSKKVAFLSIDMNSAEPEICALDYFWDKMVSGGMIILDDYGYANSTNDQKAAHDKFAKSKGVPILSLPTCQGLIIKP